jgi:[acyl-carrier-protein] S-malonyltransferase
MGRDVAEAVPAAMAVFDQANEIVGYDLKAICFEGPAEKLEQTDIQQPAIFTVSAAIWQATREGRDLEGRSQPYAAGCAEFRHTRSEHE